MGSVSHINLAPEMRNETLIRGPPFYYSMEGDSTNRELSEDELRAAGASALFVAYYNEADKTASARSEVESGPFSIDELNENPNLGGGFFAALWRGNEGDAFGRADSRNLAILESVTGKSKSQILGWA